MRHRNVSILPAIVTMMTMTGVAAGVLVAAAVAFSVSCALADNLHQAPEVTLPDLKGDKRSVQYGQGKLTLVNFWAVWCGPCREEMPQIARMVAKYGEKGFQAYGIAVESGDAAGVKSFLDENPEFGINYPILMGDDQTLAKFGDVQAVPTTFLVDSSGAVLRQLVGVTPGFAGTLEREIRKTLEPPASSKP